MMIRTPSGLSAIQAIKVRTPSGLVNVLKAYVRTPSGLVQVFTSLSAYANGPVLANGGAGVTTASSVTVTGGVGPFTYAWTQPTPDADWSALYPTNFSTQFRYGGGDEFASTFWICTVTDATGATAASNAVTASYRDIGPRSLA